MMQTFRQAILLMILTTTTGFLIPAKSQSLPASRLTFPPGKHIIPFIWQGDSVHGKWEPHAAMLIPVKLQGCPKQCYMQFDLGAPTSIIYQNKLTAIREKYPKVQTDSRDSTFAFTAGSTPVTIQNILFRQFDSSSIDWKAKSNIIIGTIGADFIDGQTAILHYPQHQLILGASIPPELPLAPFVYAGRRVLLPAMIQGQEKLLFFDTGSSMYPLLTDKATCKQMAIPGTPVMQSKAWSWNKWLTANSMATRDSIGIATVKIPVGYVTYMEGTDPAQAAQMKRMGIGGMTGNKLFLPYQLVLDTKHKMFGIIR